VEVELPRHELVDGDAACHDRAGPSVDLALDEAGEILWARAVVGYDDRNEFEDAGAHGRGMQSLHDRLVERLHDCVGRMPGQEEGGPGVGFYVEALFERGREAG